MTARAVVEPWTISIAAWAFSFFTIRDGLVLSYVASMIAALIASVVPLHPQLRPAARLVAADPRARRARPRQRAARRCRRARMGHAATSTASSSGCCSRRRSSASITWRSRSPRCRRSSRPASIPMLGPVITRALARDDRPAIADQVRQVAFWIIAAQGCLALMGSIPGEAVMGIVGPQFVAGTAALAFLLFARGARLDRRGVGDRAGLHRAPPQPADLGRDAGVPGRRSASRSCSACARLGWPPELAGGGPGGGADGAPGADLGHQGALLHRLLGAPVSPLRWPLVWAALAATAVGVVLHRAAARATSGRSWSSACPRSPRPTSPSCGATPSAPPTAHCSAACQRRHRDPPQRRCAGAIAWPDPSPQRKPGSLATETLIESDPSVRWDDDRGSVPEVAHAGEHHRQPGVVRRRDHLVVADRSARLDHRGGARLDRRQQPVGEGEERVRRDRRADRARLAPARLVGGVLRLPARRCAPTPAGSSAPRRSPPSRRPWHRRSRST